ncbi:hypothetical protein Peur_007607 [Populus x canadensis]
MIDGRQQMNAVLNRVPFLEANSTWQSNCSFKVTHSGDFFIRPAKAGVVRRQLSCPSNEVPDATSTIQSQVDFCLLRALHPGPLVKGGARCMKLNRAGQPYLNLRLLSFVH